MGSQMSHVRGKTMHIIYCVSFHFTSLHLDLKWFSYKQQYHPPIKDTILCLLSLHHPIPVTVTVHKSLWFMLWYHLDSITCRLLIFTLQSDINSQISNMKEIQMKTTGRCWHLCKLHKDAVISNIFELILAATLTQTVWEEKTQEQPELR